MVRPRSANAAEAAEDEERPPAVEFQPEGVTGGEMREYQLAGLRWLVARWDEGVNAILADEMARSPPPPPSPPPLFRV